MADKDLKAQEENFIEEVKESLDDAERLLREAAELTGDKAVQMRERALESLRRTRLALYDTQDAMLEKGRQHYEPTGRGVNDMRRRSYGVDSARTRR